MVNTRLPPKPKTVQLAPVKTVPSIEDCLDCQGVLEDHRHQMMNPMMASSN